MVGPQPPRLASTSATLPLAPAGGATMSARDLAKGGPVSAGTTETAGTGIMTIVIGVIVARTAEIVRGRASATITGATGIGAHGTVHHEVRRPPNNQQPCSPAALLLHL